MSGTRNTQMQPQAILQPQPQTQILLHKMLVCCDIHVYCRLQPTTNAPTPHDLDILGDTSSLLHAIKLNLQRIKSPHIKEGKGTDMATMKCSRPVNSKRSAAHYSQQLGYMRIPCCQPLITYSASQSLSCTAVYPTANRTSLLKQPA